MSKESNDLSSEEKSNLINKRPAKRTEREKAYLGKITKDFQRFYDLREGEEVVGDMNRSWWVRREGKLLEFKKLLENDESFKNELQNLKSRAGFERNKKSNLF